MEAEIFGAYKNGNEGRIIYISQRLVLDSLRSQEDSLLLLITLLHEYGHFLDDVLHDRAGPSGDDSAGEEGQAFAVRFMNYSEANLFSKNFEFAKLSTFNAKGEEQKFTIEMSSLNAKHRKGIFSIWNIEVGGLAGNNDGVISSSYSIGAVTGDSLFGGLVGKNGGLIGINGEVIFPPGKVNGSYYNKETSRQSDAGKGNGKAAAQMKQKSTYEGWNFDMVWGISGDVNGGYPYLLSIPLASQIADYK